MWEPLAWDNVVRDICITELPCSWLQCQENSVDPVHSEWLHGHFGSFVRTLEHYDGLADKSTRTRMHNSSGVLHLKTLKIGFDVFEHGIVKRRIVEGMTEEDESWAVGHPIMFPNILLVGNQFSCTLQFRVPIDESRTFHVSLYTFRAAPGAEGARAGERAGALRAAL